MSRSAFCDAWAPRTAGEKAAAAAIALVALALLVLLVLRHRPTIQTASYAALFAVLAVVAYADAKRRIVPNGCVVALIALWVLTVWFVPCSGLPGGIGATFLGWFGYSRIAVLADCLAAAVVVGGGLLALTVACEAATGKQALGGGDIKLLFAASLFLGVSNALLALLAACTIALAGVALRAVVRAVAKPADLAPDAPPRNSFPFAPAIALAVALVVLVVIPAAVLR